MDTLITGLQGDPPYDHTAITGAGRLSIDALNAAVQDDLRMIKQQ